MMALGNFIFEFYGARSDVLSRVDGPSGAYSLDGYLCEYGSEAYRPLQVVGQRVPECDCLGFYQPSDVY